MMTPNATPNHLEPDARTNSPSDRGRSTPEWADEFLLELRMRDVPGPRIGDLLAEVESHCADSGDDPTTAFGDPRTYAATVAGAEAEGGPRWRGAAPAIGRGLAILLGAILVLTAGAAIRTGEDLVITIGTVAFSVAMTAVMVVVIGVLDVVVRRPVVSAIAVVTALGLGSMMTLWWSGPALILPSWFAFAAGAVLLVAGWWRIGRQVDPVIDPVTGQAPFPTPRWLPWLLWVLPLTVLLVILAVVVVVP